MARKKPSPTRGEEGSVERELLLLTLSEAQRQTIRKYAELPTHLKDRLAIRGTAAKATPFTPDELDELLDAVEVAVYRAKGNERQKVRRIADKVSALLGSTIDPDEMPDGPLEATTDTVFQIKITLEYIDPPIWRRIQTTDCTLDELHELIQVTMGWEFEHLYRFDIGGVEYGDPDMLRDDDMEDACDTLLSEVLPARNRRPRFRYEYDFGDGWLHQLIVEERFPAQEGVAYPRCVAGQRACPPEDCGGPGRYHILVEAIRNPDHPEHEDLLDWLGDEFDPARFDLEAVNEYLGRMWTESDEDLAIAPDDLDDEPVERPAPMRWEFERGIPTSDFFENRSLDEIFNLQEAVENFVFYVEGGDFLTWEAVVCEEQGLPLTAVQEKALRGLISFSDEEDEQILYLNDLPRPSEPWYVILNRIVPHLLVEPFRTFEAHYDVHHEGWDRIMQALEEYGEGLSLPPGATSCEEVVPAELRHKLWLQSCFDMLSGLGQDEELTLANPDQVDRVDRFINLLRDSKESVAYFGLTLDSLLTRVILPDRDRVILVHEMQDKLGLRSTQEPIADHL
jgi:hypothetical protein